MALLESRQPKSETASTPERLQPVERANERGREAVEATQNENKPLVIKAEDIATEPQPLKLPSAMPKTAASGLITEIEGMMKANQLDRTDEIATAQENQSSLLQQLSQQFNRIAGRGERVDALEEEVGLNQARTEFDEITNRLEAKQLANRREIEQIQDQPGLTATQKNDIISEKQRKHAREEADLAIVQLASQRKFDSAQAIVDRKVDLMTEDDQNKLQALQFFYSENKDILTTEQDRQFQRQLTLEDRAFNVKYNEIKRIEDTKLSALTQAAAAGASTATLEAIQGAETAEQALSIAGEVIGQVAREDRALNRANIFSQISSRNLANQLKLQEAAAIEADIANGILTEDQINAIDKSPQGEKLKTAADLKLKLNNYESLVNEHGLEATGANKATLESAYTDLQLAYKEAANLGVLNGPDLMLVEKAISPAAVGKIKGLGNILTGGQLTRNLRANIAEAQRAIDSSAELQLNQLYARDPVYQGSQYVESLLLPFEDLLTQEELLEMDNLLE